MKLSHSAITKLTNRASCFGQVNGDCPVCRAVWPEAVAFAEACTLLEEGQEAVRELVALRLRHHRRRRVEADVQLLLRVGAARCLPRAWSHGAHERVARVRWEDAALALMEGGWEHGGDDLQWVQAVLAEANALFAL